MIDRNHKCCSIRCPQRISPCRTKMRCSVPPSHCYGVPRNNAHWSQAKGRIHSGRTRRQCRRARVAGFPGHAASQQRCDCYNARPQTNGRGRTNTTSARPDGNRFRADGERSDVDYYLKSSATPPPTGVRNLLQPGNDTIAFYSTVPGYYPPTGSQSPVSLVAYRVNRLQQQTGANGQRFGLERCFDYRHPSRLHAYTLASPLPIAELPDPTPSPTPTPAWPECRRFTASPTPEPSVEVIGPQVFRFEYYYLLKGQTNPAAPPPTPTPYSPILSDTPWDTRICSCPAASPAATPTPTGTPIPSPTPETLCCHTAPEGMQDVAAVVVVIAVIDPKSRVLRY